MNLFSTFRFCVWQLGVWALEEMDLYMALSCTEEMIDDWEGSRYTPEVIDIMESGVRC